MDQLPAEIVFISLAATSIVKPLVDVFTRNAVLANWVRPALAGALALAVSFLVAVATATPLTDQNMAQIAIAALMVVPMAVGITEAQNMRKKA